MLIQRQSLLLSIIIPAHNEEGNLESLLNEITAVVVPEIGDEMEVVLVSDHSSDHTLIKARQLTQVYPFLRVIDNDQKKGMGNALKSGIRNAQGEYVAFVMGDSTCPLDALLCMLRRTKEEKLDMIIFSRYLRSEHSQNLPMKYRLSSRLFKLAARALIGITLSDPTDAYRIIRRDFFDRFKIRRGDFSFCVEISIKAWNAGLRIGEYAGRQRLRKVGKSSFAFRRMAAPYLSVIIQHVSDRLRTRLFSLIGLPRRDPEAAKHRNA